MIELKNYQEDAVAELLYSLRHLLNTSKNEICVFQAPTGSGKTLIVSELLKRLVIQKDTQKHFSFIWISVRRLHDQSKDKLEQYYENDKMLTCSYFNELEDNKIDENEILFINWSSINKKEINIYVRENEQDNNLNSIIENTKSDGREIILIIDESHHTASSAKSRELIEVISPKITLEVSATPKLKQYLSRFVNVDLDRVKNEEMIKTEIAINPEFMNLKVGSTSLDEVVISQALSKREELKKMFQNENSNVNPLVLVQLPSKKKGLLDKKDTIVNLLKNKFDISEETGKLAIWLSEKHSDTLINIEKNDNEVEVLIFKEAIALGWDCPRASILVVFREYKSFTFTIQTIGRIMRMPELRHYLKEPELNRGFVFTNLADIKIAEAYAKDYITVFESKRISDLYSRVALNSIFLKRQRQRTRLAGDFIKIFYSLALEQHLKDKITLNPTKVIQPVIADGKILDIDRAGEVEHEGTVDFGLTRRELQNRFDDFIRGNCSPFAPVDSSDRMKNALYKFFEEELNFKKYDPKIQEIVLGKENAQFFIDTVNLSKERYRKQVIEPLSEQREIQNIPQWEVPIVISYNSKYSAKKFDKCIMTPLYFRKLSNPEIAFMDLLDNSRDVKWWFKNGENEIKYFAVNYEDENGFQRAFYPDFLVKFEDDRIGIFDTKSGITAITAGRRAEGLQKYMVVENQKGKNLWGGIAIFVNGSWRYNDEEEYQYNPNNLSSWKMLNL